MFLESGNLMSAKSYKMCGSALVNFGELIVFLNCTKLTVVLTSVEVDLCIFLPIIITIVKSGLEGYTRTALSGLHT